MRGCRSGSVMAQVGWGRCQTEHIYSGSRAPFQCFNEEEAVCLPPLEEFSLLMPVLWTICSAPRNDQAAPSPHDAAFPIGADAASDAMASTPRHRLQIQAGTYGIPEKCSGICKCILYKYGYSFKFKRPLYLYSSNVEMYTYKGHASAHTFLYSYHLRRRCTSPMKAVPPSCLPGLS